MDINIYLERESKMSNYIIEPQVFYWINTLAIIQTVLGIFGGLSVAISIGMFGGWVYNMIEVQRGYDENSVYMKFFKKCAILTGVFGLIAIITSIFIPGRTTNIEMLIAKTATFENVNWTVQQVKEVVDYIVQAIKTI